MKLGMNVGVAVNLVLANFNGAMCLYWLFLGLWVSVAIQGCAMLFCGALAYFGARQEYRHRQTMRELDELFKRVESQNRG